MNFPLIPLFSFLSFLNFFNFNLSGAVFVLSFVVGFVALISNAFRGYQKMDARVGIGGLLIALFMWVVGIVYPIIIVIAVGAVYVAYLIIWRLIVKNAIVAFSREDL